MNDTHTLPYIKWQKFLIVLQKERGRVQNLKKFLFDNWAQVSIRIILNKYIYIYDCVTK